MRLILETWSFSQSSSSSPWSMLSFLLLGLMGGGPVRWLLSAGDCRGCIRGSPLSAASPARGDTTGVTATGTTAQPPLWQHAAQPPETPQQHPRKVPSNTSQMARCAAVGWTMHPKARCALERALGKGSSAGQLTPADPQGSDPSPEIPTNPSLQQLFHSHCSPGRLHSQRRAVITSLCKP